MITTFNFYISLADHSRHSDVLASAFNGAVAIRLFKFARDVDF
jgi:hypothetical protein